MTAEEKLKLITRNLQEILTEDELKALIESETPLRHYIGFEISGKLHIGYLFTMLKIKDLQDAGAETIIWLADYHSAINDKLGGSLEVIKQVANGYFKEAFKALMIAVGGDPKKLDFKLCSETYAKNPDFWMSFLEMGKKTSLARTMRSITIMGREQSDEGQDTAKLMYPMMQAADIFLLQANIAHAGIDQRKVHVIARDNALQITSNPLKNSRGEQIKPVAIHHPILLGLTPPASAAGDADEIAMRQKMSKSKAGSGISIHDSPDEISQKINQAYAPEGQVDNNPILNWTRHLVFYNSDTILTVKRDAHFGGDITYSSFQELEKDYTEKKLHPSDLKKALCVWLTKLLEPVRKHFEDPAIKKTLMEIDELTRSN